MMELRRVERKDAAFILTHWAGDRPLPGYSFPSDETEIVRLIDEWSIGVYQGVYFEMLMIVREGETAGLLSLLQKANSVSLGISVHPLHQRRGVAAQAVRLAAEYARAGRWENMVSECRVDNAASIALHEKCGFKRLGTRINRKGNPVYCWEMRLQPKEKE